MKINIELDLNDVYPENISFDSDTGPCADSTLAQEVHSVIRDEVRSVIKKRVDEDVRHMANKAYEEFGNEKIKTVVDFAVNSFIADGKVSRSHLDKTLIPVSEKLRNTFYDSQNWNVPYAAIERVGKDFANELRTRYDMAFASNIVKGLEKQGLLKAGVFEAPIDKSGE